MIDSVIIASATMLITPVTRASKSQKRLNMVIPVP
jgi:hypothetical protein